MSAGRLHSIAQARERQLGNVTALAFYEPLRDESSGIGFGLRAQRFALIAEDGVVTKLAVEEPMKFEVSSAEAILEAL